MTLSVWQRFDFRNARKQLTKVSVMIRKEFFEAQNFLSLGTLWPPPRKRLRVVIQVTMDGDAEKPWNGSQQIGRLVSMKLEPKWSQI